MKSTSKERQIWSAEGIVVNEKYIHKTFVKEVDGIQAKLLIGEVRMTKVNKPILKQYSIAFGADTTLLLVNDGGGEHEVYSKGKFTFNKVRNFLQKHALKEAVKGPVKKEQKSEPEATKKEL